MSSSREDELMRRIEQLLLEIKATQQAHINAMAKQEKKYENKLTKVKKNNNRNNNNQQRRN